MQPNNKKFVIFLSGLTIFLGVFFVLGFVVIDQLKLEPTKIPEAATQKTTIGILDYSSKNNFFRVSVDFDRFRVEESFVTASLLPINSTLSEGILIARNGTEYPTLKDYLESFKAEEPSKKVGFLNINGYEAALVTTSNLKSYYIFVDSTVYAISTSFAELYPDLDTVAKSFVYTGN